jgi:hypothetical protein
MEKEKLVSFLGCGFLALQSTVAAAQSCQHVNGTWTFTTTYEEGHLSISQSGSTLTGLGLPYYCYSPWPLSGSFTGNGQFTATIVNPIQPIDFSFGCAPYFVITGEVTQPGCDTAEGLTTNIYGTGNFTMVKACDIPTDEYTEPNGWHLWPFWHTIAKYKATLLPSSPLSWGGREVDEYQPYQGNDTCWFPGSMFPPSEELTGGPWSVEEDSHWEHDFIGWAVGVVDYYREEYGPTVNCGTTIPQTMMITCSVEDEEYKASSVAYMITNDQVHSWRQGVYQFRDY